MEPDTRCLVVLDAHFLAFDSHRIDCEIAFYQERVDEPLAHSMYYCTSQESTLWLSMAGDLHSRQPSRGSQRYDVVFVRSGYTMYMAVPVCCVFQRAAICISQATVIIEY